MSATDDRALKPLVAVDGQPAFDEAWQAQVLALADTLVQSGMFSAAAWSDALGAALKQAADDAADDNQETYYRCALSALESLVAQNSEIDRRAMTGKREAWEQAYLSTPHGQPVELASD
ncbi:MAG: Metal chaperone, involved in Zn homeostasis [Olavius algarvensis Gamma 3 endosymbiont]|nr:MAG: Metal chaperone, involved in Zn homeostasis [Olavius algarvensis Gamma 3 endosymbiont]